MCAVYHIWLNAKVHGSTNGPTLALILLVQEEDIRSSDIMVVLSVDRTHTHRSSKLESNS
jgi:hypothetical protein